MAVDAWFRVAAVRYRRTYSQKYDENFIAVDLELKGGSGCPKVLYRPDNPKSIGFWRRYMELILGDAYDDYRGREDDLNKLEAEWHRWPVPKRVKLRTSRKHSFTGMEHLNIMDIDMEGKIDG